MCTGCVIIQRPCEMVPCVLSFDDSNDGSVVERSADPAPSFPSDEESGVQVVSIGSR